MFDPVSTLENYYSFKNPVLPYSVDFNTRNQNVKDVSVLNDLRFQIKLLENQKRINLSRMSNLKKYGNVGFGLKLSLLVVIFDIIIPFIAVFLGSFFKEKLLSCFPSWINFCKNLFFWYILITFILSMVRMLIYLFNFANIEKKYDV